MSTILLAGCTGGLGSLILKALDATPLYNGAEISRVLAVDYFKSDSERAQLQHAYKKINIEAFHWDASSVESTTALLECLARSTVPHAVIVTTGIGFHGSSRHLTAVETSTILNKLLKINCIGPALLVQWCSQQMLKHGIPRPKFVIMSSFSGVVGLPLRGSYCASKFALNGFIESLASEFDGISYVLVCPTSVGTNFRENWKRELGASDSARTAEANTAQMAPEHCVAEVMTALHQRHISGVHVLILPRGKTTLAYLGVRFPLVGNILRRRIAKASKL